MHPSFFKNSHTVLYSCTKKGKRQPQKVGLFSGEGVDIEAVFHLNRWELWAGGWMTNVTICFDLSFWTTTTGWKPTHSSRWGLIPNGMGENACRIGASRPKSKSCIDHSGGRAKEGEYFNGMKDWSLEIGFFVICWCKRLEYEGALQGNQIQLIVGMQI